MKKANPEILVSRFHCQTLWPAVNLISWQLIKGKKNFKYLQFLKP